MPRDNEGHARNCDGNRIALASMAILLFLLVVFGGVAQADDGQGSLALAPETNPLFSPSHEEIEIAEEGGDPLTNPDAALILPHNELGRPEAATLMRAVFSPLLEMPASIFDDLEVRNFVADNAAVIAAQDVPRLVGESGGEPVSEGPVLLESTIPLRTENEVGDQETVNLSLEQTGQALEPVNPLVDVSISNVLGDGITFSDSGVSVSAIGAPADRASSTIDDSVAFYPNIATDTDLAVAPTPSGVETITQLRTPDAPVSQTFALGLPLGAHLVPTKAGGAEVLQDGDQLIAIRPPAAIAADGEAVPAALTVDGNSLVVTVSPDPTVAYPIAVDPTFEDSYAWTAGHPGWTSYTTPPSVAENRFLNPEVACSSACLRVAASYGTTYAQNAATYWGYAVPRFDKDMEDVGKRPTTWIQTFGLSEINFNGYENWTADPMALFAVSDQNGAWRTANLYPPNLTGGYGINLNDDHSGKLAAFGMFTSKNQFLSNTRILETRGAQIGLADNVAPEIGALTEPGKWMNAQAEPVTATVGDAGLGVRKLVVKTKSGLTLGTTGVASSTGYSECIGTVRNPCPREWKGAQVGNQVKYDPARAPQGITNLTVESQDPLGNSSANTLQVRIDHDAPSLDPLSGSLTEQTSVGTKLTKYTLNYTARDGDDAAAVAQTPLGTVGTSTGEIERPFGVGSDGEGNVWISDTTNKRLVELDKNGTFLRQVTSGPSGPVSEPRGIAVTPNGYVWLAEKGCQCIVRITPTGQVVYAFSYAEMKDPMDVAVSAGGNVYVSDPTAKKIFIFKEGGTLVKAIPIPQPQGGVALPFGLAVDEFENAWVAVQGTNQILEYSPSGSQLLAFGGEGATDGKFNLPYDVAVASSGNLFVSDSLNYRIQEFKPDGSFLRKFATGGTASNQLNTPTGITVAPGNKLLVADYGNKRIARWEHADQDPQSGAAKVEVKVDGTVKATSNPGCTTKNCVINGSWTMNADEYTAGTHKVEVIPTDAVGISAPAKTLTVETHGDRTAPTIAFSGSMTQQATLGKSLPTYKLKVAATDPGPAEERKSGVAKVEIKVDGTVVDSTAPGCLNEGCSITREVTIDASKYSAGMHFAIAYVTDAAGITKSDGRIFEIVPDKTAPEFANLSAFYTAPSGWVEQNSYEPKVDVSDAKGYGVTSVQLKIDGKVVQSATQSCEAGSCSKQFGYGQPINMATYSGGAHPAELIASDGAGNSRKRSWTINVNPDGHISVSEATDTLEAFENTAGLQPVATTEEFLEKQIIEAGDNPHFEEDAAAGYEATGIPVSVSLGETPSQGFSIEGNDGGLSVMPVNPGSGSESDLAGDSSAVVGSNFRAGVDTVVRPEYNGLMLFSAIREYSSPTSYSWQVTMGSTQRLRLVDSQTAVVEYEDGTVAFIISAEAARDGAEQHVPTNLEVSGNVFTLVVEHRSTGVVYPVVAEQEFSTSYSSPTVTEEPNWEGPPVGASSEPDMDSIEKEEEATFKALEQNDPISASELGDLNQEVWNTANRKSEHRDPNKPVGKRQARRIVKKKPHVSKSSAPAWASNGPGSTEPRFKPVDYAGYSCSWVTCEIWKVEMGGDFHLTKEYAAVWDNPQCEPSMSDWWSWNMQVYQEDNGMNPPGLVKKGSEEHLTVWCTWTVRLWPVPEIYYVDAEYKMVTKIYPNGYQVSHSHETWAPVEN